MHPSIANLLIGLSLNFLSKLEALSLPELSGLKCDGFFFRVRIITCIFLAPRNLIETAEDDDDYVKEAKRRET